MHFTQSFIAAVAILAVSSQGMSEHSSRGPGGQGLSCTDCIADLDYSEILQANDPCTALKEFLPEAQECAPACRGSDSSEFQDVIKTVTELVPTCELGSGQVANALKCSQCVERAFSKINQDTPAGDRCKAFGRAVDQAHECGQTICARSGDFASEIDSRLSAAKALIDESCDVKLAFATCKECTDAALVAGEDKSDACAGAGAVMHALKRCSKTEACMEDNVAVLDAIEDTLAQVDGVCDDIKEGPGDFPKLECSKCARGAMNGTLTFDGTACEAAETVVANLQECRDDVCGDDSDGLEAQLDAFETFLETTDDTCDVSLSDLPFAECRKCVIESWEDVFDDVEAENLCENAKTAVESMRSCNNANACRSDGAKITVGLKKIMKDLGADCKDMAMSDLPIDDLCVECMADAVAETEALDEMTDKCAVSDVLKNIKACAQPCEAKAPRENLEKSVRKLIKHIKVDNECDDDIVAEVAAFAAEQEVEVSDITGEDNGAANTLSAVSALAMSTVALLWMGL